MHSAADRAASGTDPAPAEVTCGRRGCFSDMVHRKLLQMSHKQRAAKQLFRFVALCVRVLGLPWHTSSAPHGPQPRASASPKSHTAPRELLKTLCLWGAPQHLTARDLPSFPALSPIHACPCPFTPDAHTASLVRVLEVLSGEDEIWSSCQAKHFHVT